MDTLRHSARFVGVPKEEGEQRSSNIHKTEFRCSDTTHIRATIDPTPHLQLSIVMLPNLRIPLAHRIDK